MICELLHNPNTDPDFVLLEENPSKTGLAISQLSVGIHQACNLEDLADDEEDLIFT